MKIRQGFVTNSSSSSFIVFFPRKIKIVEELKELLFPGQTHIIYIEEFSVDVIAEAIFENMQNQTPRTGKYNIPRPEHFDHYLMEPDCDTPVDEYEKRFRELEIEADRKEALDAIYEEEMSRFNTETFYEYHFTFSDDNGDLGATLEHGDVFFALPHKQISHH